MSTCARSRSSRRASTTSRATAATCPAPRWLGVALDHADAYVKKTSIPQNVDQLDLLRFAAELRLDRGLDLEIDVPGRLADAYDKLLAERDPAFRNHQRWLEIYLAVLALRRPML